MKRIITLLMLFAFMFSANLFAQQDLKKVEKKNTLKPTVKYAAYFDHSKPLSEMIEENKFNAPKDNTFSEINKENEYNPKLTKGKGKAMPDRLAQIQRAYMANKGTKAAQDLILSQSFDGGANADNSSLIMPPDTQGDVSPSYYMQAVNNVTRIYDKSGNILQGPFNTSDFWSGFGIFAGTNDGDAIILWDENAGSNGRWLVSQFAVPASDGKYYELIAISQTDDPRGAYNRYAFEYAEFNDYPKIAVWPDGYYIGQNSFNPNTSASTGIYASVYERDQMIAGNAARMVNFQDANEFALFPSDADDFTNIPAGAPCYFINDQAAYYTNNKEVYIWKFHVDWSNTANSTFGSKQTITVSNYGFFGQTNGDGDAQAEQPGVPDKLDMLHYRTMYRAYYRPFSGHNSLLLCRTVDPANDGADADQAGIRWYEFRNTGTGAWSVYQSGTYAPGDGKWRWMPSIAMNANGDIAIGYSISDKTSQYPSLAAVARYSTDPLNVMTTNEKILYAGSASQSVTQGYTRWGDYSMVSVDPSDNYSFWFTSEYTTGGWNWKTRITKFSLPVLNPPSVTGVSPSSLYEDRGKQLTITGSDLAGATFDIGGVAGTIVSNDGSTAVVTFPAGNYTNGTLTVTNGTGSDNSHSITINTRNIIPVVAGSGVTSDNHPTIQSAVDGLFAWYGTTSFGAGDLAGAKTINVSAGIYSEGVTLNSGLNTDGTNTLTIQNNSGDVAEVDATGNNYGFDLSTVDYVTLKGFTVHGADLDNIYAQGNNVTIQYIKTYGSVGGSGIKIETGTPFTVSNNLCYSNYYYGINVNSSNNIIKNNTLDDNGHNITGPQILTYTYTGSLAITDRNSSYADINVPDNVTITNIRVLNLNITHTWDADLDIYLDHPDATEVLLSSDNGSSGDNYTNTNFDDDAATSITSGSAPFTGTFSPEGTLSTFDTKSSNGTWRLRVYDDSNGDQGTLTSWTLEITYTANLQGGAGIYLGYVAGNTVENNIVSAKPGNNNYYTLQSPGNSVSSQYNTYYTTNTNLFDYNGSVDNSGPMGTGDISSDPAFVGSGDYHIKSTNGSYNAGEWPPTTATSGSWTNDPTTDSPALDAGNPADSYTNEPAGGSAINQGAYGNTVQASKTGVTIAYTWTGATDNDWFKTSNWSDGFVPGSSSNVTIANVTNQPIINNTISNIAQCNNMTIDAGADITVDVNGYLTVNGSITNNAGTSGLIINSDDTGTGSLIQNSSVNVDATVNCYLNSGASRLWHLVSSPISAAPVSVFTSTGNLYFYDESTDDFWSGADYGSGSTTGWTPFTSGNLSVNKGYANNYFTETLNFTGQLNNNTTSSSISVPYTDYEGSGAGEPGYNYPDMDGWNLIGNPYTSAIDWDDASVAHAAAHLTDAIYVWDATAGTYKSYVNGAGTNDATQYIPAMQGFFVKGDATKTFGTLNIGANARVHNAQGYWKSTYTTPDNFIRLQITATNGYTDETVVRFLDNATSEMDKDADAYKLFTWADFVPQIYTNAEGSADYSINTLKTLETGNISILLKTFQTGDTYTISVTEFNFNGYTVYLKDNLNNITTEIGLSDIIEISSDVSDNDNRFELVFEKSTSGMVLAENSSVTLYPNPNNGQFYLTVGNNRSNYTVSISNITGQVVYNNRFKGNTSKILDISDQADGIYFVKITFSDYSSVTKKIVIQ